MTKKERTRERVTNSQKGRGGGVLKRKGVDQVRASGINCHPVIYEKEFSRTEGKRSGITLGDSGQRGDANLNKKGNIQTHRLHTHPFAEEDNAPSKKGKLYCPRMS